MKIISKQEAKTQGLGRYFTGKPCKHGHISQRMVSNSECAECDKLRWNEKRRKYNARHPEKVKASKKRHYEKHKDSILEKQRAYNERTADARKAYFRDYNDKRRDKKLADAALYRSKHAERINALLREYTKQNRDKYNAYGKLAKAARAKRAPLWLTEDDLWLMREIYSLATLRTKLTGAEWHVDHIVPLRGKTVSGLHVPTNLRVITKEENVRKNNKWDPSYGD